MQMLKPVNKPVELLLIDDNIPDIELLKYLFSNCNIPIHFQCAYDGSEASDLLFRRDKYADAVPPDLILLDLNLPKKDGKELLQEIKADPVLRKLPVIMLSTSSNRQEVTETYALGASAFISKPPDVALFQTIVCSLADFWFRQIDLPTRHPERFN